MPMIKVVKGFLLPAEGGTMHYAPGEYDVDEATANHWFVQAHLEGFVEPPPRQGTPQYAQAMLNVEQAVRRAQPVGPSTQPAAALPPDVVHVASRSGMVPEGAHYFAGQPQEIKQLPDEDPPRSAISFMGTSPS